MTILDRIVKVKENEVQQLSTLTTLNDLESKITTGINPSLVNTLNISNYIEIIAEIKKGSPSKGLFAPQLSVPSITKEYTINKACAISVLTDSQFFYGSIDSLVEARKFTHLPLLNKDFIIDKLQIARAKLAGANIILLIARILSPSALKDLIDYAHSIELEVLLEVHSYDAFLGIKDTKFDVLGINNRNLKTFETDLNHTIRFLDKVQHRDFHIISESGILSCEHTGMLAKLNVSGVLMGEALIKSTTRKSFMTSLRKERNHV